MPTQPYRTSDFLEICFLLANDARLVKAERQDNSDRVVFTFADSATCEGLVQALTLGEDMVSASRFLDSIRRARKLIHNC